MHERKEPTYEDDDLMNFGKYVNVRLMDVPVDYLHWIWTNNVRNNDRKLHNYIENSLDALKQENPDLIWKR